MQWCVCRWNTCEKRLTTVGLFLSVPVVAESGGRARPQMFYSVPSTCVDRSRNQFSGGCGAGHWRRKFVAPVGRNEKRPVLQSGSIRLARAQIYVRIKVLLMSVNSLFGRRSAADGRGTFIPRTSASQSLTLALPPAVLVPILGCVIDFTPVQSLILSVHAVLGFAFSSDSWCSTRT